MTSRWHRGRTKGSKWVRFTSQRCCAFCSPLAWSSNARRGVLLCLRSGGQACKRAVAQRYSEAAREHARACTRGAGAHLFERLPLPEDAAAVSRRVVLHLHQPIGHCGVAGSLAVRPRAPASVGCAWLKEQLDAESGARDRARAWMCARACACVCVSASRFAPRPHALVPRWTACERWWLVAPA
jgi:hypothetical protein